MTEEPTDHSPKAIVIGASAGAVDALLQILPSLPRDYPLPLIIVVHLPPAPFTNLAGLFASHCQIEVKEAEDKEQIRPATAYFAAPDYHLLIEPDLRLSLSSEEPVLYSRPSIDVLFESAADAYGDSLIGIILSGANSDGARGLKAIVAAGGAALVQTPATALAAAMPQAALAACPTARALTLGEIATALRTEPLFDRP
ncbi:MAG TPA: chemotaxis protein CheB [Chthoniobacter sp.]|nr:chemotaxis protein CheB [Chthoniobacter sp.]